ncbi:hypothetical protein AVEN_23424-1 [Araneus ventricosus]|uniref:Uncharacterized protein n=1 Tax=Araneus ventricosus TaxID=182803 RepID=A0A4Y2EAK0_ARAVE|nr:hypothetical protein AVEN_23424-1 [Araneus ventricosus]
MATYRKLAMKVKNSARTGAGVYEVYEPEFFAYEKMASFLYFVYAPRGTKTTEETRIWRLKANVQSSRKTYGKTLSNAGSFPSGGSCSLHFFSLENRDELLKTPHHLFDIGTQCPQM